MKTKSYHSTSERPPSPQAVDDGFAPPLIRDPRFLNGLERSAEKHPEHRDVARPQGAD